MEKYINHPDNNVLARYVLSRDKHRYPEINRHISRCRHCSKTVGELNSLENHLSGMDSNDFNTVDDAHISDEDIVSYVNNTLSVLIRPSVQTHIDSCGPCMKAVLRYRTYLADAQYIAQDKPSTETVLGQFSHSFRHKLHFFFKLRLPVWSTMPIAVISAMLILTILPFKQYLLPLNPYAENSIDNGSQRLAQSDNTAIMKVSLRQSGNNINWYDGYLETTAIGTANMTEGLNSIQAEQLALKAARHTAYANITEMLNGISVDANTSYQNLVANEDSLKVKTQGFVRGGQILSHVVDWQDGSPKATVTVRVPLYGRKGVQGLLNQNPASYNSNKPIMTVSSAAKAIYTGVIIDARSTEFTPAMVARLKTLDNELIYTSPVGLNTNLVNNPPSIHYYSTVEQALQTGRFGDSPVVIRARDSKQNGTLKVGNKRVINFLRKFSEMNQGRTINIAIIFNPV